MNITINGENIQTTHSQLNDILAESVDNAKPYAVALNQNFIPKSLYADTTVNSNDTIEILSPMQGG